MIEVDLSRFEVRWKGRLVPGMSVTEVRIVEFLARRRGIVRTRDEIIEQCHPRPNDAFDRNIDLFIKRIRLRLKTVDPTFNKIRSVYGVGYKWAD